MSKKLLGGIIVAVAALFVLSNALDWPLRKTIQTGLLTLLIVGGIVVAVMRAAFKAWLDYIAGNDEDDEDETNNTWSQGDLEIELEKLDRELATKSPKVEEG